MPSRTAVYTQIPWTGGKNDSVDPGFLPPTDLVIADNVIFTTNQTRKKRDAFEYFDADLPALTHRSSSGTTRTLVFAASVFSVSDEKLVVGENIAVSGISSDYNVTAAPILTITTTTNANDTITYTAAGSLTEGSTATSGTVERAAAYICQKDYWRTDNSYVKVQRYMVVTDQGKLFWYNSSGERFEVKSHPQEFTIATVAASALTTGDYFDFNSLTTGYRVWIDKDTGGGTPAAGGRTLVEVDVAAADTNAQVATAIQTALDALTGVTATVNSSTVTVVLDDQGTATAPADGTGGADTGFTFTVTKTGRSKSAPFSATITRACMEIMNDVLHVAFDGVGNKAIRYRPETDEFYYQLGSGMSGLPDFSVMRVHQSRMWANDKTNSDRLHYSAVGDSEQWNGDSTSGALDVFPGDGDSEGLQVLCPPFRSVMHVGKGQRLYRINGDDEANYSPDLVTTGLGIISHHSVVAIDLDDETFMSSRGVHSLAATEQFGDFNAQFLSKDIQNEFNSFVSTRLKYAHGCYLPELNTVFFAVTEDSNSQNNALHLMNTNSKKWTRIPDVDCQSLGSRRVGARDSLMIGTSNSRLVQFSGDTGLDYGTDIYRFRVKTGTIYPQGRPDAVSMFKRFALLYKPRGNFTITAKLKIDNQPIQALSFSQTSGGDVLGSTFILGSSFLGSSNVLAPYEQQIEGVGRGISIELEAAGQDDQIEIYGFTLEYETAERAQEVIETE